MKILKAKVRNFGSYGNEWLELDFTTATNSTTLIAGGNGHGKSTIFEMFQFLIYGKISNKKLKDIPNRLNEKCEGEIELEINNHILTIQRGLSPNYFRVAINGDFDISDKAGKLSIQEYIENEWIKIPYHLFNNIITLSINDFKSFIKMSNKDKIDIIDKIFGLSIINDMYNLLKVDIKEIKDSSKDLTTKTFILTEQIDRATQELEKLSENIINDTSSKKEEIQNNIEKLKKLKLDVSSELQDLNDILTQRNSSIKDIQKKIQSNNINISKLEDKINLFKQEKCPECGTPLQDDEHISILHEYQKNYDNASFINSELQTELKEENKQRDELREKQENIRSKIQKIDLKNDNLLKELRNIDRSDNIDKQTLSMNRLVEDSKEQLDTVLKDKSKIENKQKFYKIVDDLLSEKGIKQMAINTIIPSMNFQIQKLLKELGLEFKLEFDSEFNAKITHLGKEISHSTLSSGENKKLDFAVIVAIIKIMKSRYPGLNLLFLDELLASLDTNSTIHILKILNKLSIEHAMHIFVVHHAVLDNNLFDKVILVKKTNEFSSITIQ